MCASENIDVPSIAFPKGRTVLLVDEVAARWRVSSRHVINLIEEGKLSAFDIAGRHDYVRAPMAAIDELARRCGISRLEVLQLVTSKKPKLISSARSFWRIPVVEGFHAFMKENHSLALGMKNL